MMRSTTPERTVPETIAAVAARLTRLKSDPGGIKLPIDITGFECWEWPQGVGLYALHQHAAYTGWSEIMEHLEGWFTRRLREGLPERNVNTMAPMLTLAHLCARTKSRAHLAICEEWAEWVMTRMPRTEEGGLQHVATGTANDQQLWADTLFMTVLFLAKMGQLLDRQEYVEESIRQFLLHIKYLSDPVSGLWFHGWTFRGRHHFAKALWARGNGWFTVGVVDYLETVPLPRGVRSHLVGTLEAQVAGLAGLQDDSGMWHTLLDDRSSYLEASATAAFGYGILKGVRLGLLPESAASAGWRAFGAVLERIDADGTVRDVSFGTGLGATLDYYRSIPRQPMAYGQALALLLLGEAFRQGGADGARRRPQ